MPRDSGFSLAEVLIATTVTLMATAALFTLVQRVAEAVDAQPEVADVQQRLRIGVLSLQRELVMAGAGGYAGGEHGSLARFLAPVLPYRWGADPSTSFRSDVITVAYVPHAPAYARVLTATDEDTAPEALIAMGMDSGARRFAEGVRVVLFESTGVWNLAVVTQVRDDALLIRPTEPMLPAFSEGSAFIAELSTHTYYLKADRSTNTYQLMHFDGVRTDLPVLDDVIDLQFRYWGDPSPDVTELTRSDLTDGPWRPDEGSALRYDADLLRIRRIEVVLRVQAAASWLRGPASALFTHAGTGTASRYVPDQEVTFDVTPPNLSLDR